MLVAQVVCKCKASLFAYPKAVTAEANKVAVKVPTAVLSTTARAKKREAGKKAADKPEGATSADVADPPGAPSPLPGSACAPSDNHTLSHC